jgi:G:T-mismatch repair DNA endonuclease (very short patch repair protein)
MNLMDITKKFATPEAFVQFLEGIGWRSIVVWNCCCPVDHRAAYFRQTAPKIHAGSRFARIPAFHPESA